MCRSSPEWKDGLPWRCLIGPVPATPTLTMQPPTEPSSARRPLRERKRRRTRDDIVAAAYQLFSRHGYDQVTVADIVDAADVSRSTFFRYFGDKQEVVFSRQQELRDAVAEREWEGTCPTVDTLAVALEQLRTIVVEVYQLAQDSPHHAAHEQLINDNPELHDRHVRKLLGFADEMTKLLEHRGASHQTAVLAAQIAVACCLAARHTITAHPSMAAAVDDSFQRLRNLTD
jgi:AcrR family transcriptional regulator